jgi:hypothetical protein
MNSQLQLYFNGDIPINDKKTLNEFFKNVKLNINTENYIELYKESVKLVSHPYYKYLLAISYISFLSKSPENYNTAYLQTLTLELKKNGLACLPKSKKSITMKKSTGKNGKSKTSENNSIFLSQYKINSKPMKK